MENYGCIYLEYHGGGSDKFYKLTRQGSEVVTQYGRCGAAGVTTRKKYSSAGEASAAMDKVAKEKRRKGYDDVEHIDHDSYNGATTADGIATADVVAVEEAMINNDNAISTTIHATTQPSVVKAAAKKRKRIEEEVPLTVAESAASENVSDHALVYLEYHGGGSDKFYKLTRQGSEVVTQYGRCGAAGVTTRKKYSSVGEASAAMDKVAKEKRRKGYDDVANENKNTEDVACVDASNDSCNDAASNPKEDLESGKRVFVKGSSAMPYTLRKFNGGYSCTCPGFIINIKRRGIQATTCKHLKEVRGEDEEELRCQQNAGVVSDPSLMANRNSSIVKRISLAHKWDEGVDPSGFVMSEKLDGMRAYWCGEKLWTRSGLPIIAPEWFTSGLPPNMELDGELFLGRNMFDECMSISRRTDASDEWKRLKYIIFDAPKVPGGILDRLEAARTGLTDAAIYAALHPHQVCNGLQHLLEELATVEQVGGEGLMLRRATAPHRSGRTKDLLKVKTFHDDEALVTAYEEGKGQFSGMVGSLVCVLRNGAMFKVGSGLTAQQRTTQTAPKIGSVITFKYFELTKDGIPRFPTFLRIRPDVDASDFKHTA